MKQELNEVKAQVCLSEKLYRSVALAAKENARSVSAQIRYIILRWIHGGKR
jgi:hypothetical protein